MDNYTKERGARIQAPICNRQVTSELSSDFSLPDYQPQIKRLLRVRTTVCPPDKYVSGGSVELSGRVDYAILYTGNDGALYCVGESAEYQMKVPVEMSAAYDLNEGFTCDADVAAETVVGRVVAPRKLSVKCRLRAGVRLWGIRRLEEAVKGKEEGGLERLCKEAECAHVFIGNSQPIRLGDEILLDATDRDFRLISAEGEVCVSDTEAGSGEVNCRGEVVLKLLSANESTDALPKVQVRKIPFTASVPTEGAEVNCTSTADGVCSDLHITVEEGRLLCEVTLLLRARAQRNESVSYTKDLYSTLSHCECQREVCVLPRAMRCHNGNFSLNATATAEEIGARSGMHVVDVSLLPTVSGLEFENGKHYLSGRCRAQLIMSDGEDTAMQEMEIPFRYEMDGGEEAATDFDASVSVMSSRARMDGERISVDGELSVSVCCRAQTSFERMSEAILGEPISQQGAAFTVCYPSSEDTLWSVAKRYHRSVGELARGNELSGSASADTPASLDGVRYLLV